MVKSSNPSLSGEKGFGLDESFVLFTLDFVRIEFGFPGVAPCEETQVLQFVFEFVVI